MQINVLFIEKILNTHLLDGTDQERKKHYNKVIGIAWAKPRQRRVSAGCSVHLAAASPAV